MAQTKPVIVKRIIGPMYAVYYPHRKTGDLYVALDDHPVKCCQEDCQAEFPVEKFLDHIRMHDRRRKKDRIKVCTFHGDGKLYEVTGMQVAARERLPGLQEPLQECSAGLPAMDGAAGHPSQ